MRKSPDTTLIAASALVLFAFGLPAPADSVSSTLSEMESIAFGQSHTGDDEERLSALERKAYGVVRVGGMPERMAALGHYMGVVQPAAGQEAGRSSAPAATSQRVTIDTLINMPLPDTDNQKEGKPLQASVSKGQLKLEAGDDERFGGLWVGTLSSKIDPHVRVFCELHGSGAHFNGTMIWTSAVCGGCRRTIVGFFNPKDQACMMKDKSVQALNSANSAGFCKVDRYAFGITENSEKLSGWFYSSACKDEGAVTLTRYRE